MSTHLYMHFFFLFIFILKFVHFFLNKELEYTCKFGRYAWCAWLESIEFLYILVNFTDISVKIFLSETLASRLTYVNMKHLCASHFLYFILFVFYFELIFCEIDKITGKVLLIYIMLRSAYILMYSNYSEVLSMVKGFEIYGNFFFF